ncbi:hypothetical protein EUX98_g2103 [Antrodiella citrinella]|uniref:Uncharacterized protein n=1 Tax=Antrodiella citrinella TaxID=2447956 RepID=A0A4V3XJ79_9APHY|nr:hypothetical protein EUX98_g2103 [Antrodiella citrinella]
MSTTAISSRAAFVIYTDESASKALTNDKPEPIPIPSSRIVVATAGDKENVDPFTGQLPTIEEQLAKKRKTNVLIAKIVVTTKAPQPDQKKRKVLSASSSNTRSRGEKKERKALGSKKSRNGSQSRVCGVQELPKVEEEEDVEVPAVKSVSQAHADARCYELTVMPLADVSAAYSPSSTIEEELILAGKKLKAAAISEEASATIAEPRASSPPAPSIPAHGSASGSPKRGSDNADVLDFSTPERKRIYSAFTFSSPSPAGERFAVTSRANSVDRFSDLAFTLDRSL